MERTLNVDIYNNYMLYNKNNRFIQNDMKTCFLNLNFLEDYSQIDWSDKNITINFIRPDGTIVPYKKLGLSSSILIEIPQNAIWQVGTVEVEIVIRQADTHVLTVNRRVLLNVAISTDESGGDIIPPSEKESSINKLISDLNTATVSGENTKQNLDISTQDAETSKANLDNSIFIAGTKKQDLDTANDLATQNKSDLDTKTDLATQNITNLTNQNTTATENIGSLSNNIEAYNNNTADKIYEFNSNATSQTTTFNSNVTEKTDVFNNNYTEKLEDFNANATLKIGDLDTSNTTASENISNLGTANTLANQNKRDLDAKNTLANQNIASLQANVNTYNQNAINKTNVFNQNSTDKTNEFNTNASAKISDIKDENDLAVVNIGKLQSNIDDYNQNVIDKVNLFDNSVVGKISDVTVEGTKQINLVSSKGTEQVGLVTAEGSRQVTKVKSQSAFELEEISIKGSTQVGLVTSEGTKQVANVKNEGDTQVSAITTEVNNLKTGLDNSITTAITTKQNLDISTQDAETSKANLDNSIFIAGTKKQDLDTANDLATQNIQTLQDNISSGNSLNTNLEDNIETLNKDIGNYEETITNLNEIIITGNSLNTNLEDNITTGNSLNTNLEDNITSGEVVNDNLELTISTVPSMIQSIKNEGSFQTDLIGSEALGKINEIRNLETNINNGYAEVENNINSKIIAILGKTPKGNIQNNVGTTNVGDIWYDITSKKYYECLISTDEQIIDNAKWEERNLGSVENKILDYVDDELNYKSDKTEVINQLNLKADKTEVDNKLSLKEPKIIKNSGFNLDKSDDYDLNDSNLLFTTRGAKLLIDEILDGAGEKYDTLKELQVAIQNNDVNITTVLTELSLKEPKIIKNSGFNLDKSSALDLDDDDILATSKSVTSLDNKIALKEPKFVKKSGFNLNKSDSVTSNLSTVLATSLAVKTVFDKADSAYTLANSKEPKIIKNSGFNLDKSDSVTSISSDILATSKAVNSIYTLANTKEPKITKNSGFNLDKSDSITSTSTDILATSKAVKAAYDRGSLGVTNAATAQSKANSAYTLASKKLDATANAVSATKLNSIQTTFTGTYPIAFDVNGTIYSNDDIQYTGSTKTLTCENIASPNLTGTPTAPTPSASDNSTKIATTAFVKNGLNDLANTKEPKITKKSGFNLDKSDSTTSTSTTTLATSKAVKAAYDRGSLGITNAATAQSKADSAYTLASKKFNSTGGTISGNTVISGNLTTTTLILGGYKIEVV